MLSLRSLVSLETKVSNEKHSKIAVIKSPNTQNKSAEELYRANYFSSTKNTTSFAFSSIHLYNNHNINWVNELNPETVHNCELSLKLNSAKSSFAELRLPFDPEPIDQPSGINFTFDSFEISNNFNADDTITLIPKNSLDYFDSSFRSIDSNADTSIINITLANPTYESKYDLTENVIHKMQTMDSDHVTETFTETVADNIVCPLETFPSTNFRYMYQIGHGAFGVVNKSFHFDSCQIVAIKQCRSSNNCAIKSFKKEINICNEFKDCPFIINMIEYGNMNINDHKILIALEYMNMGSLNKNLLILNNNLQRIKHISFCILNALDCLHNKLYVHNDIKPANILFNDNGDVKLSDFGCIEQMENINSPLQNQFGTEYYQSYEKRFVSPIKYTTKSDIYSFGITISQLLNPNNNKNNNKSVPFIISQNIIQKYNHTNPELIDFLNKCLIKDYNIRWSASQLLKHPFLNKKNINDKYIKIKPIQDIDDLEFMVNSLIDYYSHYKYDINNNISIVTPIDNKWTDAERLNNIAKCSGCSVQFVKDFICKNVNKIKDKYLKC